MAGLAVSLGVAQQAQYAVAGFPSPSVLSVSTLPDGTVEVSAEGSIVTITVISPAEYAGTYEVASSALAEGPVSLVRPTVGGTGRAPDSERFRGSVFH